MRVHACICICVRVCVCVVTATACVVLEQLFEIGRGFESCLSSLFFLIKIEKRALTHTGFRVFKCKHTCMCVYSCV